MKIWKKNTSRAIHAMTSLTIAATLFGAGCGEGSDSEAPSETADATQNLEIDPALAQNCEPLLLGPDGQISYHNLQDFLACTQNHCYDFPPPVPPIECIDLDDAQHVCLESDYDGNGAIDEMELQDCLGHLQIELCPQPTPDPTPDCWTFEEAQQSCGQDFSMNPDGMLSEEDLNQCMAAYGVEFCEHQGYRSDWNEDGVYEDQGDHYDPNTGMGGGYLCDQSVVEYCHQEFEYLGYLERTYSDYQELMVARHNVAQCVLDFENNRDGCGEPPTNELDDLVRQCYTTAPPDFTVEELAFHLVACVGLTCDYDGWEPGCQDPADPTCGGGEICFDEVGNPCECDLNTMTCVGDPQCDPADPNCHPQDICFNEVGEPCPCDADGACLPDPHQCMGPDDPNCQPPAEICFDEVGNPCECDPVTMTCIGDPQCDPADPNCQPPFEICFDENGNECECDPNTMTCIGDPQCDPADPNCGGGNICFDENGNACECDPNTMTCVGDPQCDPADPNCQPPAEICFDEAGNACECDPVTMTCVGDPECDPADPNCG